MLALTRKFQESVLLGDNQEWRVTVLGIQGSRVRLGFEGPGKIMREELVEVGTSEGTDDGTPPPG